MYAYSGHLFGKNYNNEIFKVAFNTHAVGTDGPYLYSVTGKSHLEIKKKLFSKNNAKNCSQQRKLYPDHRWFIAFANDQSCLLYTSPSPRDRQKSRMPSSA